MVRARARARARVRVRVRDQGKQLARAHLVWARASVRVRIRVRVSVRVSIRVRDQGKQLAASAAAPYLPSPHISLQGGLTASAAAPASCSCVRKRRRAAVSSPCREIWGFLGRYGEIWGDIWPP